MRKQLTILSGAGISAESGISTFRDSGGLWEKYNIQEVASIDGWYKNKELMLEFYNQRRRQLKDCNPNAAHHIIADLEKYFDVHVITQNIDDLHERAGSTNVLHLHGELIKACNSNKTEVINIHYNDILPGEKASDGLQLRPFIVWFGEDVPLIDTAIGIVEKSDIIIIIGTSLQVYPAAGLIDCAQRNAKIYLVDPQPFPANPSVTQIQSKASVGMEKLSETLLKGL